MTRTITSIAGLALLVGVAIGSLTSAKMTSPQLANRVVMNEAVGAPQTDATGSAITRDRWAAYWNRIGNAKELDVLHARRPCATY